jgi:Glycosyl hydrolase catalytic core
MAPPPHDERKCMGSLRRVAAPLLAFLALALLGCTRVDFGVANYASKNLYSKDLDNIGTKWWLGGEGVYDPAQQAMTRGGYNHIPTVPVGRDLLRQGTPPYVHSSDPQNDHTTCQKISCPLPTARFAQDAQAVVAQTGHGGLVWNIGNEVETTNTAGVAPSIYVEQFDAWVAAIKAADPTAMIMAPSLAEWGHCGPPTCPWGNGHKWFDAFVSAYRAAHGVIPPLDILSEHYSINYVPGDTTDYFATDIEGMRDGAAADGYPWTTPIWITEATMYGWPKPANQSLTSIELAALQHMILDLAQRGVGEGVAKVFWFSDDTTLQGARPVFDYSGSSPYPLTETGQALRQANLFRVLPLPLPLALPLSLSLSLSPTRRPVCAAHRRGRSPTGRAVCTAHRRSRSPTRRAVCTAHRRAKSPTRRAVCRARRPARPGLGRWRRA